MNAELAIVLLVPAAETLPTAEYTAAEFIIVILAAAILTGNALVILTDHALVLQSAEVAMVVALVQVMVAVELALRPVLA